MRHIFMFETINCPFEQHFENIQKIIIFLNKSSFIQNMGQPFIILQMDLNVLLRLQNVSLGLI